MEKKLTPEDITRLALERKSIHCPKVGARWPAAFLQNMQFMTVMRFLSYGCYEYKKSKSEAPFKTGPLMKSDF